MQTIKSSKYIKALLAVLVSGGVTMMAQAQAVDVAAAEALAKSSKCTKCHAADKEKTGTSYKKIAAKYKGKADAEAKLTTHLNTGPKVKIDGVEEDHAKIASTDAPAVKNLVQYILSR